MTKEEIEKLQAMFYTIDDLRDYAMNQRMPYPMAMLINRLDELRAENWALVYALKPSSESES